MTKLVNRAKMTTATTGTGTITLGSAVSGYQSFSDAGVVDTDVVRYVIEDGTAWEIGTGTYTASGTTLSRTPSESSNADAAINLSGTAVVYVTAAAADIVQPDNNLSDLTNASTARTNLGLAIGTNVQAYDADLAAIAGLAVTDGNFIVGNGTTWVAENGATARTSLGLGTIATQASNNVSITGGSISGITDLAVADGGTGASDAATARTNLGLAIGTNVQAYDAGLQSIAGLTTAADRMIYTTASDTYAVTTLTSFARGLLDDADAATARTTLGLAIGTNVQAYDADLAAVAALSTNGMIARTGAGTAAARTITGTANQITVTNGDGVSGNPTLSIPSSPQFSGAILNDGYTEEVFAVTGTTPALSPTNGSIQTWTLSGNSTPTAGTWAAGQSITLMVDDGTAYTITWTSLAVTWKTDGGSAPTLNTTGLTAIALWKVGTTIYGARVGDA